MGERRKVPCSGHFMMKRRVMMKRNISSVKIFNTMEALMKTSSSLGKENSRTSKDSTEEPLLKAKNMGEGCLNFRMEWSILVNMKIMREVAEGLSTMHS